MITTYAELQVAVASWLNRTDLTSVIPDFISIVDARLNRLQLTRDTKMLIYDDPFTGTLPLNSFFPEDGSPVSSVPLSQSMTNLRSLVLFGVEDEPNSSTFSPPLNAPVIALVPVEQLFADRSFNPTARMPIKAAVLADEIIVSPLPDNLYRWQIQVEVSEPLSDTNPTNTVLAIAPDVYLYGALVESAPYLKDDPRIAVWEQRFMQGISELQEARLKREWPNTAIAPQPRVFT